MDEIKNGVVFVTHVTDNGEAVPRSVQKPVKADNIYTVNDPWN